jgi:PAS domain S-box-containing protein
VKIREELGLVGALFSDLVSRQPASRDIFENELSRQMQNRLQSQLLLKSERVLSHATQLKNQIGDELFSIQRYTNWISVTLIVASSLFSVIIGFFIGRSIMLPIKNLIWGTETIIAGNLEFRLKTDQRDEMGQLSKSFVQMVNNLKTVMVSRDELEHRVKERTAELRASNRLLRSEIDERKRTEGRLAEAELKYRTVADYTFDWEYWENPDGSLQYVSPSCERICGYKAQDFMVNPSILRDIIVPEDRGVWEEHRCSARNEMKSGEIQFRIQRPDGGIRWIEHACQPVFDRQGNNQGVRASNRDITERESYKSEKTQLQSELAHMDRVVTISALTSALAHEINQPLAAMRSYAQAALRFMDKDHPEYDSVRKALQGIVADNKRASAVVNRLRAMVKKGTADWDTLEINSIINEAIGFTNSEIVLRNASITLNLQQDVPSLQGDSVQLQQVVINLLTNALDAMDDQPVGARNITVSTNKEKAAGIAVSVSDSGKGIDPDKIHSIFDPFHTTKAKGIGLGLAICKSIIEAHGGKISADNNPDGGATFSFTLPVDKK